MMKKRKITALALAAALLISTAAGCSSGSASQEEGTSSQTVGSSAVSEAESSSANSTESGDPVTLRIFCRLNPEVQVDDNPILHELEKKLNIVIDYEAPPLNSYNDKLQITLASGDLPDLIYNHGAADANYEQWVKSGLLAELDDLLPNYPNLMDNIPEEMFEAVRSVNDQKIHLVPRTNMDNYYGFIINKEYMEALGMENPTTLDEVAEVWRAMTYNDPDGNGQDDTYGISFALADRVKLEPIMFAFGLFWDDGIPDRDGTYKMYQKMSGYIPYITWLRDRYAEGVIDPEFITNKTSTHTEKFQAGTAGMITSHQAGAISKVKTQPNALDLYEYIAGPVDQETGELNIYNQLPIWGGYMIPADSPNVEKCLELLDYGNSQEGFQLMSIGIEGVHYNSYDPETQTIDRTEEQTAAYNSVGSTHFTFAYARHGMTCIIEGGDTPERVQTFHEQFDPVKESCNFTTVPAIRTPLYSSWEAENPDLLKEFQEMEVKYVVGEISLEEYEEFLNNKYFPAWEEAEAEYIKYMESLNQ